MNKMDANKAAAVEQNTTYAEPGWLWSMPLLALTAFKANVGT
jgi:hypothetical protein